MRIVLDTNILVSGLLGKQGPSGELLRLWIADAYTLVTSTYQVDEFRRVIAYARLKPRIQPEQAAALLDNMGAKALILEELPLVDLSPDPDDNPILAGAIAGRADMIVSGDKSHMVALGTVEGIPVLTPRQAVAHFRGAAGPRPVE